MELNAGSGSTLAPAGQMRAAAATSPRATGAPLHEGNDRIGIGDVARAEQRSLTSGDAETSDRRSRNLGGATRRNRCSVDDNAEIDTYRELTQVNAAELRRIITLICHHDIAGFSEFDEHDLEIGDLGRLRGDRHGGGRCRCDRFLCLLYTSPSPRD